MQYNYSSDTHKHTMEQTRHEETTESFKESMQKTVLSGFRLIGISLGVELGMFKAFAPGDYNVTSTQLAERTSCKERYVREWLHHMVMCDVIDVDETGTMFSLRSHRRDVLTDNTQLVAGLGSVLPYLLLPHRELLDCFHADGPIGLPFEKVLPSFATITRKSPKNLHTCAEHLRDTIPGLQDKLDKGIRVCEVGVGRGVMITHLASQFPRSHFTGIDLSETLLAEAREVLAPQQLDNVTFHLMDATLMPVDWDESFDYIYIRDVLHDIAHVGKALANFYRCLKPGGQMSVFEIGLSSNPYLSAQNPKQKMLGQLIYLLSTYHCLPASMNTPGSSGLGAGSGIDNIVKLIKNAGFTVVGEPTSADYANMHILAQKPASVVAK